MTNKGLQLNRVKELSKAVTDLWKKRIELMCNKQDILISFIMEVKDNYCTILLSNKNSENFFIKNKGLYLSKKYLAELINTQTVVEVVKKSFIRSSKIEHVKELSYSYETPLFWPDGDLYGFFCVISDKSDNGKVHNIPDIIDNVGKVIACDILDTYYSEIKLVGLNTTNVFDIDFQVSCTYCDELIAITDLNGKILSCNQNSFNHLGYELSDLIDSHINQLATPADLVKLKENHDLVKCTRVCSFEIFILDKFNNEVKVDIVSQLVDFNDSEVIVYVIKNKSLEMGITKAIQKSELILTEGKFFSTIGHWIWEVGTGHIHLSHSLSSILGIKYGKQIISLAELNSMICDEDRPRVRKSLHNSIKTKKPQYVNFKIKNSKNEVHLLQCRREAITDSKGEVIQLVTTVQDITKQRRFEKTVLRNRNKHKHLFEAVCGGFFFYTHSKEDIFTYLSPGAELLLGKPISQLLGSNWRDCAEWVNCDEIAQSDSFRSDDEYFSSILEYIHPNGTKKALLCSSVNVRDCDGETIYYQGFAQDITQQKRLEEELVKAKEKAEAMSIEKSKILANLSHEMRTPMNAINGLIHILNDSNLDYRQQQYIEKLKSASNWLIDIINNTLDFSKIEAGKIIFEKIEFSLRSMISKTIDLFDQRVGQKDLILKVDIHDDVPDLIIGDPIRTMQVVNNFISNAIKFTKQGHVHLDVELANEADSNLFIHFKVKDTGIGISENKINNIFQAFTQADNSITREYGGTGLGLTICKQLTELMGGTIWVKSSVGVGSEFNVVIPYLRSNTSALNAIAATSDYKKILIIGNINIGLKLNTIIQELNLFTKILDPSIEGFDLIKNLNSNEYCLVIIDLSDENLLITKLFNFIVKCGMLNTPTLLITAKDKNYKGIDSIRNFERIRIVDKPIQNAKMEQVVKDLLNGESSDDLLNKSLSHIKVLSEDHNILVVEDVKINQIVVEELLKKCNLNVVFADNGYEAIELAKINEFSAVFMDIEMPQLDGYETTIAIRELPNKSYSDLPIIAMTAHSLNEDDIINTKTGFNDYITKPINPKILYNMIARILSNQKKSYNSNLVMNEVWFEKLKKIQLFNLSEVIHVVDGNYLLYKKLLIYFLNYIKEAKDKLLVDIYNRDINSIRLVIHDLKGISGTIGAYLLVEKCKVIEKYLTKQSPDLVYELAGFGIMIKQYTEELDNLFFKQDQNVLN